MRGFTLVDTVITGHIINSQYDLESAIIPTDISVSSFLSMQVIFLLLTNVIEFIDLPPTDDIMAEMIRIVITDMNGKIKLEEARIRDRRPMADAIILRTMEPPVDDHQPDIIYFSSIIIFIYY